MSEEGASESDTAQEAKAYIAVVFVFDEKTNILRANLTKVALPTENSLQALQETLSKEGYSNFQYKPEIVESLVQKATQGETGSFEIAVRKEYTSIDFVFDENSNQLSAQFSVSYEENRLNH
ncbi:MAG: deoxyribodipyrimidine photolyase, partial [Pseudohongiellaceae bacterium]